MERHLTGLTTDHRRMRVLAYPARRNRERNPFNYLLSEALTAEGCDVVELDRRNSLFGRWDVFHLHWPQQAARGSLPQALGKSFILLVRLGLQRIKGARIVWTVHNVQGHDRDNPRLERVLMRLVTALIHGAIFLTASSRAPAIEAFPALASKPHAVVPHGLYRERSQRTPGEARATFGLPPSGPVIGFLGDIRAYKGLDQLLLAFEETHPPELTLLVAGAFHGDHVYAASMRARIAGLQSRGYAIVFRERRLDDKALADAVRACDIVALLYQAIWNSGLAILVLENDSRILASDAPPFRELCDELGPERVRIVAGKITGEELVAACSREAKLQGNPSTFLAARAWHRIAADTVAFYRRLGACRHS
jgi:glycosyltransferase involved in cell wall biosynthesis